MTVLGDFQSFPHIPDQVAPDTEGGLIGLALIAPFLQSSDKPLAVPTLGTRHIFRLHQPHHGPRSSSARTKTIVEMGRPAGTRRHAGHATRDRPI